MYDDENFDDGFDEQALSTRINSNLWRQLFGYALRYPKQLRWLGTFAVITALMEVAYPLLTKGVIDEVEAYINHGTEPDLWFWGIAYFLCTVTISMAIGGFIFMAGRIRTHIAHDIRQDGFANLQRLSFEFFDYRPVGWLMARMTSDSERLSNILAWGFLDLIWGATMMTGIAIAMFIMDWKLACIVFSVLPLLAWVSAKFQRRILQSARQVRATNSRITANYNEAIMGVLTSKAFVRERENQQEFGGLTDTMYKASVTNLTHAAIYLPLVITMASLATGLALAAGGINMLAGIIPVSTLIAFMAYTRHFFDPIEQLGHWFAEMQMAQASAERILSLIEAEPSITDNSAVREAMQVQTQRKEKSTRYAVDGAEAQISQISLRDVSFAYDPKKPVLEGIDLDINKGETVAIVGPTGGGKSTLVNLICRFYEPTRGQVLIDGVDYRQRSLHWLQSNLGMVLQNAHVFSGSLLENIRYGRLDASDDEVIEAAKIAGAHDFITAFPDGYQTEAGESGTRLSAGQKQLVSFARAVLADPQILVMDEATSSVDTETEQRIQHAMQRVLAGRIALVIAHRLSTVRNADRIVVIQQGVISESGTHNELMASQGHYYNLYRQQSLQESSTLLAPQPTS
ncbi:MAG: ATP-binding cassette subfamily B protein [Limisphaerales bacterium]|jgi:ATP-binding cassette subfamily B protein